MASALPARPILAAALALAALSGCVQGLQTSAKPQARPAGLGQPVTAARPTSEASASLRSYLGQVQTAQLSQGLLRQDGGGDDVPFTADMLARNFEQIVFYNEYANDLSGLGRQSPLRRWEGPVRLDLVFGEAITRAQRMRDTETVRGYAARLEAVSGHPVSMLGTPNFLVVIADEDDRAAALDVAASRLSGIDPSSLDPLRVLPRDTYCAVAAYATGSAPYTYTRAVALIRTENPGLLRLSCFHEELAQGLGLANDSPEARPSIFNDDDEFALLTRHDELLLRMLYDPRLRPGMTAEEARPIVRILARELVQGEL